MRKTLIELNFRSFHETRAEKYLMIAWTSFRSSSKSFERRASETVEYTVEYISRYVL